jgi:menaquinone-dependent protoporphyrinogen oxidase
MTSEILVAVASRHGATLEIGQAIAAGLERRGASALAAPTEEAPPVEGYDAVVIGSAVYYGHWLDSARGYVDAHREALAGLPVWLFSSGPLGPPEHLIPEGDCVDAASMIEATGAIEHHTFGGKLARSGLRFRDKAVASALHAPEGDFRDWHAIEAWAGQIAEETTKSAARLTVRGRR